MIITLGKIKKDDQILLDNVEVWFKKTMQGSLEDWYGCLFVPQNLSIGGDGTYRLELNDGCYGDIVIKPAEVGSCAQRAVYFQGIGPLN